MIIYNYHPITHEYTGLSDADEDPLDVGKWLIPANATNITPPEQCDGKARIFNGLSWVYVDVIPATNNTSDDQPIIDEIPEQQRADEIVSILNLIDMQSIRPLRAIVSGTQTQEDLDKLTELDEQAAALRVELNLINQQQ